MFIAALFPIAEIQKKPMCPLINEDVLHTHTHIYTQRNITETEKGMILALGTTWLDPEDIMLSEISQTNTIRFHFMCYLKNETNKKETNP